MISNLVSQGTHRSDIVYIEYIEHLENVPQLLEYSFPASCVLSLANNDY